MVTRFFHQLPIPYALFISLLKAFYIIVAAFYVICCFLRYSLGFGLEIFLFKYGSLCSYLRLVLNLALFLWFVDLVLI